VVLGAGGHGTSVLSVLLAVGVTVNTIVDDDPSAWGTQVLGVPVRDPTANPILQPGTWVASGLGSNTARRDAVERFPQVEWVTVIHPIVYINPTAQIGQGSVLFPGAVIGADVVLGSHAIVSSNCTIGHDTIVGDYVQVAPGVQVAGGVRIGEGVMLGIGSTVCPEVTIGEWSTLAAGAVAIKGLPAGCMAMGVPAKPR
jgi:sugar O-acyltransferase (sialic acid O-acetyltransferase NeuD family)